MDVVASPALTAVIKNLVKGDKIYLVMSKQNCVGVSKLVGGSKLSYWGVLIFLVEL